MLVPKLRFPGFEGRWPSKKIGEILTVGNGRDYNHLGKGNIPVYGTGGYMLSVDDYLYEGESVAIGRKGTINKPQFLSGKFWTVDTLFYTRDYVDSCPRFVFEIFNNINWQRYNEATGVPSLSKSTIEKIKVNIPSKQEQEKIAAFLTAVDERIELQSNKVEKLQTYKRGLTQKIFTRTLRFKCDDGSDFLEWSDIRLREVLKERKQYATKDSAIEHISLTTSGVVPKSDRYERDFLVVGGEKNTRLQSLMIFVIILQT